MLLDFARLDPARAWRSVDDVVIGGVSASRFELVEGVGAVFEGRVSLENGGGFASVRSPDDVVERGLLAGCTGLELDLRGDGRAYKFNVRLERAFDGVVWQGPFAPPRGERVRVRLPFTDFVPTFRGRAVRDAGALDPARITSFGLVIAGGQAGPFRLELASIRTLCANR